MSEWIAGFLFIVWVITIIRYWRQLGKRDVELAALKKEDARWRTLHQKTVDERNIAVDQLAKVKRVIFEIQAD